MPKLICPNCTKFVTVPDDAAGTTVPCPECKTPFPVPARYDPVVAVPPAPPAPPSPPPPPPPIAVEPPDPPPGYVPPAAPPPAALVPAVGYARSVGVTLRPRTLAWVPAVGLTAVFALTLFTWVGSYVGGHPVYSQSAWRALTGYPARNYHLEELTKQQAAWPADVLNRVGSDWVLMLPYLAALVVGVALAWAERVVPAVDRHRLPRQLGFVADVWPHRVAVLGGLAAATTLLLVGQMARGFGLERAMRQTVVDRFADDRKKAEGDPAALDAIEFKADQELNRFNLERTVWLKAALGLHLAVVLAMLARAWLDRRGDKPPPRLVLQY